MPRLSPVHSFSPVTIENRRTATFPGEDDFGQHNLGYSSSDPGGGHPACGRPRMNRALVGFTGFVGGNLVQQMPFDVLVNSGNSVGSRGDADLTSSGLCGCLRTQKLVALGKRKIQSPIDGMWTLSSTA